MKKKKFAISVDLETGEIETSHFDYDPKKRQELYSKLQQELYSKMDDKQLMEHLAIAVEIMTNFCATVAIMNTDAYKYFVKFADVVREYRFQQTLKN